MAEDLLDRGGAEAQVEVSLMAVAPLKGEASQLCTLRMCLPGTCAATCCTR